MDDELYVRCNGCVNGFYDKLVNYTDFMSPFVPTTHTESGSETSTLSFDLACTGDEEGGVSSLTDERNEDISESVVFLDMSGNEDANVRRLLEFCSPTQESVDRLRFSVWVCFDLEKCSQYFRCYKLLLLLLLLWLIISETVAKFYCLKH